MRATPAHGTNNRRAGSDGVTHGTRSVVGDGAQRQSSDIQEQYQEELVSMQYSGEEDLTN